MSTADPDRALQGPQRFSKPLSPPLISLKDADVIISLLPGEQHNLHLTSELLRETSWFFWSALGEDWVNEKITGVEDVGDGRMKAMKRFELQFDSEGGNFLVGKKAITPEQERLDMIDAALESVGYNEDRSYLFSVYEDTNWIDETYPLQPVDEREVIATVNFLGFSMLCGHPMDLTAITKALSNQMLLQEHGYGAYIVQRLVQWVDQYGALQATRWRLMQFIMTLLDRIGDGKVSYLRLASVLRDEDFFKYALNRTPLINVHMHMASDSMDTELGLNPWLTHYQTYLTTVAVSLQDRMFNIGRCGLVRGETETRRCARRIWQDLLFDMDLYLTRYFWLLGEYIIAPVCMSFDLESLHSLDDLQPETFKETVQDMLYSWISEAEVLVREYLTDNPSIGLEFRINNREFFDERGFPWDFRDPDVSDDYMLSLLAAQGIVQDRKDLLLKGSKPIGFGSHSDP